jgi:D-alanine-D-alanine ligase
METGATLIKLGIIFGGRSGEHAVSLMSAASIISTLDSQKFQVICIGITRQGEWRRFEGMPAEIESGVWEQNSTHFTIDDLKKEVDFVFPVLHGTYGEDGTIQGLFEMLDIPYAGCGVLASSLAMDKIAAKTIFDGYGLPICKYKTVMSEDLGICDEKLAIDIEEKLSNKYPLFVKPANLGSSVGINKAKNREQLIAALYEAAKYDRRLLVEEGIDGREIEVAMLGNSDIKASITGEIVPSDEFYSYTAKYFDDGQSKLIIPVEIDAKIEEAIREMSIKAYASLDCAGFARVDFFLEKTTNKIYINEINTIPGFTKFSMFPLLWKHTGINYSGLLERIVELGYERYNAKNNRETASP